MRKSVAAVAFLTSLVLAITGCAGGGDSQQETTATPSGDCIIEDSLNTVGQTIGQRTVMHMSKADAKAMSAKEFSKLIDEETTAANSDGTDFLTVDFGDGTGMVFPSCTNLYLFYGELDSEGMMAGKSISYSRNGMRWVRD